MRPVNLYLLTRDMDKNTYTEFENILSARKERMQVKEHEFGSLRRLVDILQEKGVFPAGCAVVAATEVLKIQEHHWDELGMPETLWCNKVKEFGPLIVSIDAKGNNLFEEQKVIYNERKEKAKQAIYPEVKFIK